MTAHAPIKTDPVAAFMPWVEDNERGLRRRLLAFQQRAGTRARTSDNDQARTLWWMICDTAAGNAFAPASPSHLQDVLAALSRLSLSADAFERWESPRG
jgi:hypothetical protein